MALVLQGRWASLMHNGGAYGDGTAESGVGVEPGAACTTGKHGQFPFASGGTGDSGADRFAERGGKDEPTNCPAIGTDQRDRGQMARSEEHTSELQSPG